MKEKGLELIEMTERYLKEIDDCPFISHSLGLVERLCGAKKPQPLSTY